VSSPLALDRWAQTANELRLLVHRSGSAAAARVCAELWSLREPPASPMHVELWNKLVEYVEFSAYSEFRGAISSGQSGRSSSAFDGVIGRSLGLAGDSSLN
jgi:hypothetical protein